MGKKPIDWIILISSVVLVAYHTYYIVIGVPFLYILACWHMMLISIVIFFNFPWFKKGNIETRLHFISNLFLSLIAIGAFTYLITMYADTIEAPEISRTGEIIGIVVVVIILEACRRALGVALPLIAVMLIQSPGCCKKRAQQNKVEYSARR